MSLLGMFSRKPHERAGFSLYTASVRAARDPYFYAELGVPDTMDGRFDMIGLHACLLIDRIHREEPAGKALAQAVFDAMFLDMDGTLRELGVADIRVGRNVKAMWEALNGRSKAYAAPLEAGDEAGLAEAIGRNVWRGSPPVHAAQSLAALIMRQYRHLGAQPFDDFLAGKVDFLPPESVSATVPA